MQPEQALEYTNWAVVGATIDPEKYGNKIYKKLKNKGYNVYPISPKYDEIEGDKAYRSLKDLPQRPDIVNFVVNPKIGLQVVEECAELGVQTIWLQPGTVSEELLQLAEKKGIEAIQACVLVALNYQ